MTKRRYLDEVYIKPKYEEGGLIDSSLKLGLSIANSLGINKKYKGKNNKLYARNLYNLINPTNAYPKTVFDAIAYKQIADAALQNKSYIYRREGPIEPLAEAAWAKRLGLPYDTSLIVDNNDGTYRLNEHYEKEIPTDTTFYKNRIINNAALKEHYKNIRGLSSGRKRAIDLGIAYDTAALDSLRKTYKTGKWVSINEHSNTGRKWLEDGVPNIGISPLSALQNYSIRYNKKDNTMEYVDNYDFNEFEQFVPGTPFKIKGKIKLNKKYGGLITTRPSLKSGGSIYIKPSHRGRLTELKARTGKSESELYNDGNPAHKKMVVFARNARKWHH